MKSSKLDSFYRRQAPLYDITRQTILFDHAKAVKMLDLQSDDIVYDIACGTGKNIPNILKTIKPDQLHAFDYSHALLAQARQKFPGIHLHHADVTVPLDPKIIKPTKIICSYSLTMIHERERALKVMSNLLPVGGKLIILDFYSGRKPRRRGKLLQAFLRRCDINLDQDVVSACHRLGLKTTLHVMRGGYNMVVEVEK